MKGLVASPELIRETNQFFQAMLKLRYSSPLFRLRSAEAIMQQVRFRRTLLVSAPAKCIWTISMLMSTCVPRVAFTRENNVCCSSAASSASSVAITSGIPFPLSEAVFCVELDSSTCWQPQALLYSLVSLLVFVSGSLQSRWVIATLSFLAPPPRR
jgi:hypothetical protein